MAVRQLPSAALGHRGDQDSAAARGHSPGTVRRAPLQYSFHTHPPARSQGFTWKPAPKAPLTHRRSRGSAAGPFLATVAMYNMAAGTRRRLPQGRPGEAPAEPRRAPAATPAPPVVFRHPPARCRAVSGTRTGPVPRRSRGLPVPRSGRAGAAGVTAEGSASRGRVEVPHPGVQL